MPPAEKIQGPVPWRLETQFQPEIGLSGVVSQQRDRLRRQAVGAGADNETHHIVDSQRLVIETLKSFRRRVGVGVRLEIGQKALGLVLAGHDLFARFDLRCHRVPGLNAVGARSFTAAKDAAAGSHGPVPVGTGKSRVNGDSVYPAAKDPFQFIGKCVVAFWHHESL